MTVQLAWGIIATGNIARTFARGVQRSRTGSLAAVGSRSAACAEAFARDFAIPHAHGSYDALLADDTVEAVYIATPHPHHAEWAIKAAEAGKHILCEKPLGLNHPQAMAIVQAAEEHDVFLMEAFMYRCHPQTRKLVELIRDGAIGDVRLVQASFGFDAGDNLESRLLNPELGGGGILDVGCYPASMARLVAGAAHGKPFLDHLELTAVGHVGPKSGVDEWTVASVRFPGDIVAQLSTSVRLNQENNVRIFGTGGSITLPSPWIVAPEGGETSFFLHRNGSEPEEISITTDEPLYAIEADTVAAHLADRQAPAPAMSPADTLGNMRLLDHWREALGMEYPLERPERQVLPLHNRPLRQRPGHAMCYGRLPGLDKPVARIIMGVDNQRWQPHASVMFDDYFERGGNTFDTAWVYGQGACEKVLGHWVHNRDVREEVVLIDKGAHTPWCNPDDMEIHLQQGLEWLQTDYLDIYLMHRDNPEIPVGAFIELLNKWQKRGRIRVFGASNWTRERYDEANAYAAQHGLNGFIALSNNFSLARLVEAPWDGCLSARDPEMQRWLTSQQIPLLPWSSQASGFFAGCAAPDDHSDPNLVRCWYSNDNFERLQRARRLAKEKHTTPAAIALAYVLQQPFPTFPLIGPRRLCETRESLAALSVELTENERLWLDLQRPER